MFLLYVEEAYLKKKLTLSLIEGFHTNKIFAGFLPTLLHVVRRGVCRANGAPVRLAGVREVPGRALGAAGRNERVPPHRQHFTCQPSYCRFQ